jgi:hypothetical protein
MASELVEKTVIPERKGFALEETSILHAQP